MTTIDQSKKLLEAGLPKETADVCWKKAGNDYLPKFLSDPELGIQAEEDIPAWTITHILIDIIPQSISGGSTQCLLEIDLKENKLRYIDPLRGTSYGPKETFTTFQEAVVGLTLWLLEKGQLTGLQKEQSVFIIMPADEEDNIGSIIYSDRGTAEKVRAVLENRDGKSYKIINKRLK